ncbi:MAG: DNA polymerase III subunit alpha, partial [Lentisphaeria bacterium]|nr:DNA polymerase III subunit alpha [Lentisphaeria bacterium]
IWENIKKFADYGFNKSHSAAYAIMSYRTAYLKANYRPEFMAAVMTSELSNSEKLEFLISECRDAGIRILPPDVNTSDVNFTVDGDAIRFGLGAIKGFGTGVSQSILEARKDGPFKNLTDLLERTDGINSKALESLIRAGALDSTGLKRSQLLAMIESSIAEANATKRDRESGQASLFDLLSEEDQADLCAVDIPDIPEMPDDERLEDEKRLLGFYVSGHPLDRHKDLIRTFSTSKLADINKMPTNIGVKLGGMLTTVTRKLTKQDQKPFAIFQLEDLTGNMECICYNKVYEKCKEYLIEGAPVFVRAITKRGEEENAPCALLVQDVIPLMDVYGTDSAELHIHFDSKCHSRSELEQIGRLLSANSGNVPVVLCIHTPDDVVAFIETGKRFNTRVSAGLLAEIDRILGSNRYKVKASQEVPQPKPQFNRDWKKDKEEKKA